MPIYNGYTKPQNQKNTIENEIAAIEDLLTRYPDNQYWINRLALVKRAQADLNKPVCNVCNFRHDAADYCTGGGVIPATKPSIETSTAGEGVNQRLTDQANQARRDLAREYNALFTKK